MVATGTAGHREHGGWDRSHVRAVNVRRVRRIDTRNTGQCLLQCLVVAWGSAVLCEVLMREWHYRKGAPRRTSGPRACSRLGGGR